MKSIMLLKVLQMRTIKHDAVGRSIEDIEHGAVEHVWLIEQSEKSDTERRLAVWHSIAAWVFTFHILC